MVLREQNVEADLGCRWPKEYAAVACVAVRGHAFTALRDAVRRYAGCYMTERDAV